MKDLGYIESKHTLYIYNVINILIEAGLGSNSEVCDLMKEEHWNMYPTDGAGSYTFHIENDDYESYPEDHGMKVLYRYLKKYKVDEVEVIYS